MDSTLSLYPPRKAAKTQDRLLEVEADSGAWRSSCGSGKCGFTPDFVTLGNSFPFSMPQSSHLKWHCNSTYWHIETR